MKGFSTKFWACRTHLYDWICAFCERFLSVTLTFYNTYRYLQKFSSSKLTNIMAIDIYIMIIS